MKDSISLIIPVHNEADIIGENLKKIDEYLKNSHHFENYEILICDNGSEDNTLAIAKKMAATMPNVKVMHTPKRGLGKGIALGLSAAEMNSGMFYAMDLPFGLDIIEESSKAKEDLGADVVIGSKRHPESKVEYSLKRKIFSKAYNTLINLFFGLGINDTQGSIYFDTKKMQSVEQHLDAPDAFYETQMIIYSKLHNHTIQEIPVTYINARAGSKMKPLQDGMHMFKQILQEHQKVRKVKKTISSRE